MTPRRFETLVDAYGADWDRWPAAERPAALALLAADPALRRHWEAARALDARLDRHAVTPLDDGAVEALTRRLLAGLPDIPAAPAAVPAGRFRIAAGWSQPLVGGLTAVATALALLLAHPLDHGGGGGGADLGDADVLVIAMSVDGLEDAP